MHHVTGFTTATDFPLVNGFKTASNLFKTTDRAGNWNNNNTGLTGDVRAIGVAPNEFQMVYAGTAIGLFRSNDGGATWTKPAPTGSPAFAFTTAMASAR